jgi:hypothetical protein
MQAVLAYAVQTAITGRQKKKPFMEPHIQMPTANHAPFFSLVTWT